MNEYIRLHPEAFKEKGKLHVCAEINAKYN